MRVNNNKKIILKYDSQGRVTIDQNAYVVRPEWVDFVVDL
jgi:hypothetical protein